MTTHLTGVIANGSPCVRAGGTLHRMPATRQPVREWLAELQPCPHCGAVFGCGCIDWLQWMAANVCPECGGTGCDCVTAAEMAAVMARIDADPHGVNNLSSLDIPF